MFGVNQNRLSGAIVALGIIFTASLAARPAHADVLTWTGSGGAAWDVTTNNWSAWSGVSGGPYDSSNGTGTVADFTTAGASATVTGGVYTNGIRFDNTATVSGGTINFLSGTVPVPTVTTNAAATINSVLSGNFTTSGISTLTLGSAVNSAYAGTVTVSTGTVSVANASAIGSSTNIVIGDANSGAATPTLKFSNGQPNIGSLTVGTGINGANVVVDNTSAGDTTGPTINGVTTLNSPLTFTYAGTGSQWHYTTFKQNITGNGGGSGNDTLIFKMPAGTTGNPYWQYDGSAANDFLGNVHVVSGNWAVQNFGNPGGNVMIPDASMFIVDSGATWTWNNTSADVVETIDGLAGGGTINKNLPNYTFTINSNNNDNEGKRIFTGTLSGMSGALTLGGTGTQEFSGPTPNFTNATNLNNGTLRLTNATNWGSAITMGPSSSPILQLNAPLVSDSWNFTGQITSTDNAALIQKTGSGTVNITASQFSFSGTTAVSGGALYLNDANSSTSISVAGAATLGGTGSAFSAAATVAKGGILDFSQNTGGAFSLGSLTYGGSSTLNLGVLANYTAGPFLSTGALSTLGQININANLGTVSVLSGTYDLVSYSSLAGAGTSAFHLASVAGLSSRQSAALLGTSSQLELVVNGQTPYWNGSKPDWSTANAWTLQPGGTPTTFITGDGDIFDDSASTGAVGGVVALNSTNVAPGSVTFSNLSLAYTVSGSFGITGSGAMAVQGGGSVTILNANSYTGATTVSNGMLQLGNGGATGSLSSSGAIALGGNGMLAFSRSDTVVQGVDFGSPISGAGSLVQNGPGALILIATNTYAGSTTISGGTLQLGAGGTSGSLSPSSTVTINGATLTFNRGGNSTFPNQINGFGTIVQAGSGMTTLTTEQTQTGAFNGDVNVTAGTLQLNVPGIGSSANGGVFKGTNPFYVGPGATLDVAQERNLRFEQPVTVNAGTLNFSNPIANFRNYVNTLNLTNAQVTGTSFAVGLNNSSPAWTVSGSAGNTIAPQLQILNNGNATFTVTVAHDTAGIDLLWSGDIVSFSDGATFVKDGPGKMVYTGANSYNGPTTISAGTLQIGNGGASGNLANGNVTNNANLVFSRSDTLTVANAINGTGAVTQNGSGATVLTASNTYTGTTAVNAGALYVNGSLAGAVTVNGGVLGGSGTAPSASVAIGGGIEGGYKGTGTLTLGSLAYAGSGSFTTNGYTNYPASGGSAPLSVTGNNAVNAGGSPIAVTLSGPIAVSSATFHLIQYSGAIGGIGTAAFTLASSPNTPRGQLSYGLVNNPGYLDVAVNVTPVIWTGSLSTAWKTTDTDPAPRNWSYVGGSTNFHSGDIVRFDNSTASGGTVDISNGDVLPTGVLFNNDAAHTYTLTGSNGISGPAALTKTGGGQLIINSNNSFSGPVNMNGGTISVATLPALGSGALTFNSGALHYTGASDSRNSAVTINAGGGTIAVDAAGATVTVGGAFSGTGPLTKNGLGGLTLAGAAASPYSGAITVSQGTLDFNNSLAVGGSTSVTLGNANTGTNAVTMLVDSAITAPVMLANIYTSSYGTSQTIVLNAGSSLGGNTNDLTAILNLSGSVPLTIQATNNGGHSTAQDWSGQITGTGIPAGSTALVLDGSITSLRLTWANGDGTLPANNFTGDVLIKGNVSTQGDSYLGAGNPAYQNLGFLNNNVTVASGATWRVVWGGETVEGLFGSGTVNFSNQNALNNIGLTVGNNDASGTFSGSIVNGGGNFGLDKTGSGTQVLSGAPVAGVPTAASTFTGPVIVDGGTLVAAAVASGGNSVFGALSNSRTVSVNSGATLLFVAPNATAPAFNAANVPTLNISGGTVTNAEPGNGFPTGLINNALNNVNLTDGVLTATTGQHGGYAAWNINGMITSSGNSQISTSDPIYGTVMLSSSGGVGGVGVTTFDVTDGTLTVSAPLVQDNVDGDVSGLSLMSDFGSGTLVLSGTNSYMGGTTVNSGTLIATNSHAIADGTSLSVGDPGLLSMLPAPVVPSAAVAAAAPASISPVPEPGTLALLAAVFGGAILYRRMRRR